MPRPSSLHEGMGEPIVQARGVPACPAVKESCNVVRETALRVRWPGVPDNPGEPSLCVGGRRSTSVESDARPAYWPRARPSVLAIPCRRGTVDDPTEPEMASVLAAGAGRPSEPSLAVGECLVWTWAYALCGATLPPTATQRNCGVIHSGVCYGYYT